MSVHIRQAGPLARDMPHAARAGQKAPEWDGVRKLLLYVFELNRRLGFSLTSEHLNFALMQLHTEISRVLAWESIDEIHFLRKVQELDKKETLGIFTIRRVLIIEITSLEAIEKSGRAKNGNLAELQGRKRELEASKEIVELFIKGEYQKAEMLLEIFTMRRGLMGEIKSLEAIEEAGGEGNPGMVAIQEKKLELEAADGILGLFMQKEYGKAGRLMNSMNGRMRSRDILHEIGLGRNGEPLPLSDNILR